MFIKRKYIDFNSLVDYNFSLIVNIIEMDIYFDVI